MNWCRVSASTAPQRKGLSPPQFPDVAALSGAPQTLVKRSVRIAGHSTSVSLEAIFWDALGEIAERRAISVATLLTAIDARRTGNLSSAVRVFVLQTSLCGEISGGTRPEGDADDQCRDQFQPGS
ncbi:MAG: ribbon-helix-helix domain-containing protein [Alphaproteobacteria bacterium]|nr:ribbon-helix-helix domain-containing protein [Alphaproteobacteria bacterium]